MKRAADSFIPTRRSLLSRLKNWDDQQSWNDFFHTYWRLIYNFALKSGLTDVEAQEVVQETIITVSKQMPNFKYDPKIGSFKSWLLHTTGWRITDQMRKRLRHPAGAQNASRDTAGTALIDRISDPKGADLERVWDEEWKNNLLEVALERVKATVKARQYQIFDLYVIKQWPVEKVAKTLSISVGQVYLAKHRIAAVLKKEIKELETQQL
jgi:RNA polymerase sigma factor (sigma-70 family)